VRIDSTGKVLFNSERDLSGPIADVAEALATKTASDTARLVPVFGPTVAGEQALIDALDLDLSRALLAGINYTWSRPFMAHEKVNVVVRVDQVFDKGCNRFAVVVAEFTGADGQLVQTQTATFVERLSA
jgi:hypothetical protein